MTLNWIDVDNLSFNCLLLLEREQLSWLPGWLPEIEFTTALSANPAVEWYLRNKNPELSSWVDSVMENEVSNSSTEIRACEIDILCRLNDLICYAIDPEIYDKLPFLGWDPTELNRLAKFTGKIVLDIGAGTGKLAFIAAQAGAYCVFAVEPVNNLRVYIKKKARNGDFSNVFVSDGLMTDLPFPDDFIDIVMSGHVFGDYPESEYQEMMRVVKSGGMVILCPGNNDKDNEVHAFLVNKGFRWSKFEEPEEGIKRKYWKLV
jgi:SAM-dependent methyltransferase